MCLAIPMKVISVDGINGTVKAGGLSRRANLSLLNNVKVGDYVLLHAGFAIEKVREKEAKKTIDILKKL